jgi:hypothetical protein
LHGVGVLTVAITAAATALVTKLVQVALSPSEADSGFGYAEA